MSAPALPSGLRLHPDLGASLPAPPKGADDGMAPRVLLVTGRHPDLALMAAALLDQHAKGRLRIKVVTAQAGPVPPPSRAVCQVMAEIGLPIAPSVLPVTHLAVVHLGAATVMIWFNPDRPVWQAGDPRIQDWFIDEAATRPVVAVRQLRAALDHKTGELAARLLAATPSTTQLQP